MIEKIAYFLKQYSKCILFLSLPLVALFVCCVRRGVAQPRILKVKDKIVEISQQCRAENFMEQVPEQDNAGCTIPQWKRLMMAKKIADKIRKDNEQQILQEAEAKRLNSIPVWKRNLLNKKDGESIYGSTEKLK